MKKLGIFTLSLVCMTSALSIVLAAETPAATVEAAKPETLLEKTESVVKEAGEKIEQSAEKAAEVVKEKIEGEKKVQESESPAISAGTEKAEKAEPAVKEEAEKATEPEKVAEPEKATNTTETAEESKEAEPQNVEVEEEIVAVGESNPIPAEEEVVDAMLMRACIQHLLGHINHCTCRGTCGFGPKHEPFEFPWEHEGFEGILPEYCIGALALPLPEALRTHFGLKPGHGLWVEFVIPNSPAEAAGIHRGDILLEASTEEEENGQKIQKVFWLSHPMQFIELVNQNGPEKMNLRVICNGQENQISITPAKRCEILKEWKKQ